MWFSMEIETIKVEKGRIRLKIIGETFTFGNLLQKALIEDDRILGAGFHRPHPLKKEIIFDIYFKDDVDPQSYKEIVIENVKKLHKYISELKEAVLNSLEGEEG